MKRFGTMKADLPAEALAEAGGEFREILNQVQNDSLSGFDTGVMAFRGVYNMIILGLDPGLATTGYGVLRKNGNKITAVSFGCIKTPAKMPNAERLKLIREDLKRIIKKYKPDRAGIEQLFFCKNLKTAIAVGQARGVILLTLAENKLPIYEFTPLQIKQNTTNYGKADKKQVQKMLQVLLNLKKNPKQDDAADALATAYNCAVNLR